MARTSHIHCILLLLLLPLICALQFSYTNFSHSINFLRHGNVSFPTSGGVRLCPDPRTTRSEFAKHSLGRFVYHRSVRFLHPPPAAAAAPPHPTSVSPSFSTSFTFRISTTAAGYGGSGDGFAFFIAPNADCPGNCTGGHLGLINGTASAEPSRHLFAVEFDTYQNRDFGDPSASHIGLDINAVNSSAYVDTTNIPSLNLYKNYTFTAWIDYNASSHLIELRMTNDSLKQQRPRKPCLSHVYDLSSVFQSQMYVGLSAATGDSMEGLVVYYWNFFVTDLETSPSRCRFCKRNFGVALGVSICFLAACIGLVVTICYYYRIRLQKQKDPDSIGSILHRYSYKELRRATHGFSDKLLLGRGAFAHVYKGVLSPAGTTVAIKRLNDGCTGGEAQFQSAIGIISRLRHRNLLQLQGFCYEKGKALLVYDFMANHSLDTHLFAHSEAKVLAWATRFNILLSIAAALEYLHEGLEECVLHRDVKAANVLLNADFEAVLGDFGLARLIRHDQIVTMTAAGTPGYLAPEVVLTGKGTDRADVYSFGVLALEVACGRRVQDSKLEAKGIDLLQWVWLLNERDKLLDAMDPRLAVAATASEEEQRRCVLHVGLLCCHPVRDARPRMLQVRQMLKEVRILPLPTSRPVLLSSSFGSASFPGISRTISGSSASSSAMPNSSTSTLRSVDP